VLNPGVSVVFLSVAESVAASVACVVVVGGSVGSSVHNGCSGYGYGSPDSVAGHTLDIVVPPNPLAASEIGPSIGAAAAVVVGMGCGCAFAVVPVDR
jgi:hypothetical protein